MASPGPPSREQTRGSRASAKAGTEQAAWALQVGQRLAAVRQAAGMTRAAVTRASNGEFKPNTLEYYEEGKRTLSLPRLARLAQFYNVQLSELLPGTIPAQRLGGATGPGRSGDLIVDIAVLDRAKGAVPARLRHFCHLIIYQRGTEPTDGLLRLRRSDQAAVAALLGVTSDEAARALDDLAEAAGTRT